MTESGVVRAVERLRIQIELNKLSAFQYNFRVLCEKCLENAWPYSTFSGNNSKFRESNLSSVVSNRPKSGRFDHRARYFTSSVNVDGPIPPKSGKCRHSHSCLIHSHVIVCLRFLAGRISIAMRYNLPARGGMPTQSRGVRHPGRHRPSFRAAPPPVQCAPPCRPLVSGWKNR